MTTTTITTLTGLGFTVTKGQLDWRIASKTRPDGRVVQVFIDTDGNVFSKAVVFTPGQERDADSVSVSEAIK